MTLGSTQLLTEMSTGYLLWGGVGDKGGWSLGLTSLPHSCADCQNRGSPTSWRPPGSSGPVRDRVTLACLLTMCFKFCVTLYFMKFSVFRKKHVSSKCDRLQWPK